MAENRAESGAGPQEVPFSGSTVGCAFLVLVPAAVLFAFAAFDLQFFNRLAEGRTPRNWLGILRPFQWGGVNVAVLALVGYLVFELQRLARRFADPRAVWIEGDTICFHPTVRRRALPLAALEDITHELGAIRSFLWLKPKGGKRIRIVMVDKDAARVFLAEVQRARAELTFG